jgi:hypothetical protein
MSVNIDESRRLEGTPNSSPSSDHVIIRNATNNHISFLKYQVINVTTQMESVFLSIALC